MENVVTDVERQLTKAIHSRNLQFVIQKVQEMKQKGERMNKIIYTCLIEAYSLMNKVDGAVLTFQEMKGAGYQPERNHFNTLLRVRSYFIRSWRLIES